MSSISIGYSQSYYLTAKGDRVYRITGTVTEMGVPGPYRVRAYDRLDGSLLAETWSGEDGAYVINGLPPVQCFVVAFDHGDNPLNAAISDYVTPEPI